MNLSRASIRVILLSLLFLLFLASCLETVRAQQDSAKTSLEEAKDSSRSSDIQKIGENLYRLGSLTINSATREITAPAKFNMERGPVELIACAPGGKVHESILVIDVVPYHLQVALLLLGLNFGGGLTVQGDSVQPRGDSVEVWVQWKSGGKDTLTPVGDLVWDLARYATMEHTPFVFSGSKVVDGKFMADAEKSLITTYRDPYTILDNPLSTGANDEAYKVNEKLVPAKGTSATVTIKALK